MCNKQNVLYTYFVGINKFVNLLVNSLCLCRIIITMLSKTLTEVGSSSRMRVRTVRARRHTEGRAITHLAQLFVRTLL